MLLQFHLFFVAELHHHGRDIALGTSREALLGSRVAQWQAASVSDAICAACRVSQRGAVQPAAAASSFLTAGSAQPLPASVRLRLSDDSASPFSGRAPPLS
jgi:hypothetical protein